MFDVSVERVNVMNRAGQAQLGGLAAAACWCAVGAMKKAIVTLAEGQTIDVFEGVK